MGLKLRYNLFYQVASEEVYSAYSRFYSQRNATLENEGRPDYERYDLYEPNGSWTILSWNIGWEWIVRREAQFFVSKELQCPGFLIFVDDGDYWAYEFFDNGVAVDHFIQDWVDHDWFPNVSNTGNPQLIANRFNWLSPEDIVPYLVQEPDVNLEYSWKLHEELDVPPRPGDEYTRFDELSALNFLRLLGIKIEVLDHYVTPQTKIWRTFWIKESGSS